MSSNRNPWGSTVTTPSPPVKLHDVMDSELAQKLQREEEEQWEREIKAQFGDRSNVGWCFVEVPSADCEYGVMSVIQQEISVEDDSGDPNDPDYALALELQAQEAEEYDRLRRQEASSMERIQIMEQEPSKRQQVRRNVSSANFQTRLSSDSMHSIADGYSSVDGEPLDDADIETDGSDGDPDDLDHDDEHMYLEDDCGLYIRKFNALDITSLPRTTRSHRKTRPTKISNDGEF